MSGHRRIVMAGRGEGSTDDINAIGGLLFHASFRQSLTAETGQILVCAAGVAILPDADLSRNVAYIPRIRAAVKFSQDGLPAGDAAFSIALWLKIFQTSDRTMFFGWGSTPWSNTVACIRADTAKMMTLSAWNGKDTSPALNPDYGVWHHWCGTYDGDGQALFFRDGEFAASGSYRFDIGVGQAGFNTFWAGELAEYYAANARIYDRALSPAEVRLLAREMF